MRWSRVITAAAFALLAATHATGAHAGRIVEGDEHCVVNVRSDDGLNMRTGPGTGYAVIRQKPHDACGIVVTGPCAGNWCPVEDGHDDGWMHSRYLSVVSPALYCVVGVAPDDVLNLRRWPSPRSRILSGIAPNACGIAFLPYRVRNWQKIRTGDGRQGWVNAGFLSGQ